jgi:hypothetical protein
VRLFTFDFCVWHESNNPSSSANANNGASPVRQPNEHVHCNRSFNNWFGIKIISTYCPLNTRSTGRYKYLYNRYRKFVRLSCQVSRNLWVIYRCSGSIVVRWLSRLPRKINCQTSKDRRPLMFLLSSPSIFN